MRVGSLFAGIGGFDLAARWFSWETVWYSEIDPYACAVMRKNFPDAVNLGDVRTIVQAPPVDLLCGGFPCQDISLAGRGAGLDGERSGLWSHYRRLVEEIRPRWVVIENVAALRSRGLDRVVSELDALGYVGEWHCIPASYVGAPHRRDRIWIIAHSYGKQLRFEPRGVCGPNWTDSIFAHNYGAQWHVAHSDSPRLEGRERASLCERTGQRATGPDGPSLSDDDRINDDDRRYGTGPSEQHVAPSILGSEWWGSEPDVGRVANGVPARMDRLRCLGNAIVPQVAALIFSAIDQVERERLM